FPRMVEFAREVGFKALLVSPLMSEGTAVGAVILRRQTPGAFTPRQIELLETFAAQAGIALPNTKPFTRLRESLEQQTATADILRVISQSPTDVAPVLDAVAKAAVRFCGAEHSVIVLREGDQWRSVAHEGPLAAPIGQLNPLSRDNAPGQTILDARV